MVDESGLLVGMLVATSARDGATNSSANVLCHAAAGANEARRIADSCPATQHL
jgi:hypothetical protein